LTPAGSALAASSSRAAAARADPAVLTSQHEHGAEHDFLAILGRRAGAQFFAHADIGDIGHADRYPPWLR
jgi:hypothetical protein